MLNQVKNVFKLVSGGNLIIIALAMFFFRYFKVVPILNAMSLPSSLNGFDFSLLVLASVCIAAAGYVANGYFNFENNQPYSSERTVIGTFISLDNAFVLQAVLNVAGIALAYYLAWKVGNYELGNLYVVFVALLLTYAMFLKRWFVIGDLVISALYAFIFVIIVAYETQLFSPYLVENYPQEIEYLFGQMKGYALFAFIIAFIIELMDDMSNKPIDEPSDAKTLAVVLPVWASKLIIILVTVAAMFLTGNIAYVLYTNGAFKEFWYITLLLQSHFVLIIVQTLSADKAVDYRNAAITAKSILLYVILSLPLFWFFNG
ncbi:MAG TPA: UbiA family prenyltransferase [Chitinophagales bacterium]